VLRVAKFRQRPAPIERWTDIHRPIERSDYRKVTSSYNVNVGSVAQLSSWLVSVSV
jgi:hypothetical protein